MPNHITNVITASPRVIDAITRVRTDEEKANLRAEAAERARRYKERTGKDWEFLAADLAEIDERFVDFGMVVPPPSEGYDDGEGCSHQHPFNYDANDPHKNCWYSWNRAFWGTKWNGYSGRWEAVEGDLCKLTFDTAWSHPAPVIHALSLLFPDEVLEVEYADEDFGGNLARYKIRAGEAFEVEQPEFYSEEAYELAARIKYGRPYAELRAEWDQDDIETARHAERGE